MAEEGEKATCSEVGTFTACLLKISQFLTTSAVHSRLALYLASNLAISANIFFLPLMREVSTEIFQ